MALFQKKPQSSSNLPFYTLSAQKSLLIIGLGNPGEKYAGTRHNIGSVCVNKFAELNDFPAWTLKKELRGELSLHILGESRVVLLKPTVFMNLSGQAVGAVARFYKIPIEHTLVVHDELDIPFGQIRSRVGGSSAGHNGVQSVIDQIGEGFGRIRIGIGPKKTTEMDSADFVLQAFSKTEQAKLPALTKEVAAILSEYVYGNGVLPAETRTFLL